jgi:hypothetical protein
MNGMTLKRIALGFALTPPLPAALWAISLWRDHDSVGGAATLGGTFLNVLPRAYLAMAIVGLPAFFLARRLGGWIAHIVIGILAVWLVEILFLTLMGWSEGGLPYSKLPSALADTLVYTGSYWLEALLVPALLGSVAGSIFWAVTRTRPQPFQGRFS